MGVKRCNNRDQCSVFFQKLIQLGTHHSKDFYMNILFTNIGRTSFGFVTYSIHSSIIDLTKYFNLQHFFTAS